MSLLVKEANTLTMIPLRTKEINAIGYNEEERAIYVQDNQDITRVFSNKSKEDFEQFFSSTQHDYFYLYGLRSLQHKIIHI
jgi:hypothetical protein